MMLARQSQIEAEGVPNDEGIALALGRVGGSIWQSRSKSFVTCLRSGVVDWFGRTTDRPTGRAIRSFVCLYQITHTVALGSAKRSRLEGVLRFWFDRPLSDRATGNYLRG